MTCMDDTATPAAKGAHLAHEATDRGAAKPAAPQSKSDLVAKLLARAKGATVAEVSAATGWQAHSVRAFFSGLRKKGTRLVRDARKSGEACYRTESKVIAAVPSDHAVEATAAVPPAALAGTPDLASNPLVASV